jgi:hypothetical protein
VRKSLKDMGTGENFLDRTAMACAVRLRIDKWDLIKLQSFCKAKDSSLGWKQSCLSNYEKKCDNPRALCSLDKVAGENSVSSPGAQQVMLSWLILIISLLGFTVT